MEEEKDEKEVKDVKVKLKKIIENEIEKSLDDEIDLDYLYKLIDIHKDIENEEYWKIKGEYYNEKLRKL